MTLPAPHRQVVYVAAPFGGDVETYTAEAVRVCRLLQADGYAPFCVHPTILAGGYGDDDSPEDRAAGLDTCVALVRAAAFVVAIERPEGGLSSGVQREVDAALARGIHVYVWPWRWRMP